MRQRKRFQSSRAPLCAVFVASSALVGCMAHQGPAGNMKSEPVVESDAEVTGPVLRAPEGFYAAAAGAGEFDGCSEASPPFTGTLDFPSKYEGSDSARDQLNEAAAKRYREQIADIRTLERGVTELVEAYLESGDPAAAECAVDWLARWARADAMTGEAITHTGKSMRKWSLGSVASAYLRLKLSTSNPLENHAAEAASIEAWLDDLATRVMTEWGDVPPEKFNNHEYWSAWSVMATAVVLDDREKFRWAVSQYRRAAQQITDEGYLPNELSRDTRALFYHNYALPPLTMIAAFAQANGVPLLSENGAALQRLAQRVMSGTHDPRAFVEKTGSKQKPDTIKDSKFTWLEPYCTLIACSPRMREKLEETRPLQNQRVGGNLTRIFSADGAVAPGDALPASSLSRPQWRSS